MADRIVMVTKLTRLEDLLRRYHSRSQVKFFLESRGGAEALVEYEEEHARYRAAFETLVSKLPRDLAHEVIARELVPTFLFRPNDLVITVGPDGLVVNVAKYLDGQPVLAVNPDPERIDGVLARWSPPQAARSVIALLAGECPTDAVALARAVTNDGQELHAVNDFLVGRRDPISARYTITHGAQTERQSSSGVLVCTGCGSTGWMRSVIEGALGIISAVVDSGVAREMRSEPKKGPGPFFGSNGPCAVPFTWDARRLLFAVREPFPSKATKTGLVFGRVEGGESLVIASEMSDGGAIFADGVIEDAIAFNAGTVVRISVADRTLQLIRP